MLKVILLSCLFFAGNTWAESADQLKAKAEKDEIQKLKDFLVIYRLGAELGNSGDQFNLGLMYQNGMGTIQDYKESIKWFRLAAQQGDSRAQLMLGGMYYNGRGVIRDYKLAHMWFNIAAANGHKDAGEVRDDVALEMTSEDISKAQDMAREWVKNHP
jgi:uncharacterized protein